jgi:3-oxoadipate enol-lactonase
VSEPLRYVSIGTASLAVAEGGCGPPMLLVHGFPLDHGMWGAQIRALSSRVRVIAPDLRGFGQSSGVASDAVITMQQFADDLAALLDAMHVAEPVVYCGLSMGGYIAWPFARKYAARLRGLVLCDTRAAADAQAAAAARLENARRVLAEGPGVLAGAMLPKLFSAKTRDAHPELVEALRATILAAQPAGVAAALRGMAQRPDATGWLSAIDCPTLAIVGEEDVRTTPDEMRSMAANLPHARMQTIPGAGHMAPLEQPDAVNAAIAAFLDALPPATGAGKAIGS